MPGFVVTSSNLYSYICYPCNYMVINLKICLYTYMFFYYAAWFGSYCIGQVVGITKHSGIAIVILLFPKCYIKIYGRKNKKGKFVSLYETNCHHDVVVNHTYKYCSMSMTCHKSCEQIYDYYSTSPSCIEHSSWNLIVIYFCNIDYTRLQSLLVTKTSGMTCPTEGFKFLFHKVKTHIKPSEVINLLLIQPQPTFANFPYF